MIGKRCWCGEQEPRFLFSADFYQLVACCRCGQVRVLDLTGRRRPQVYSESDIAVYMNKEAMFRGIFRRVINFVTRFRKDGVLIDIGAGVGLLVDEAQKAGFQAYGYEPSLASVRAALQHFHMRLIPRIFSSRALTKKPDIIILNHVLEHVSRPEAMIHEISQVLKKGGLLVIGVPNFASIMAQLKRSRWQSLIPDQHRWQFTLRTLDNLIMGYGFQRIGYMGENHDRIIHPLWKRSLYWLLDLISIATARQEAMLVAYRKL